MMPAKDKFHEAVKTALIKQYKINLIVYDPIKENLIQWIS